ncbi:Mbov_0398 family ICE element protein [Candidatus Mycoplasma pogonae]
MNDSNKKTKKINVNALTDEQLKELVEKTAIHMNDKKQKTARFSGRFSSAQDAALFAIYKDSLSSTSLNKKMQEFIVNGIQAELYKEAEQKFKKQLFYAFQKAIFASNKKLHNKLQALTFYIDSELSIINDKLNVLLNAEFGKIPVEESEFDNLSAKALRENEYFKAKKSSEKHMLDKLREVMDKKVKKEEKTNKEYLEDNVDTNFEEILDIKD